MSNLDQFKITRLANGNVQGAFKAQIEGVFLDTPTHYDADAGTDWFTPILGRANPFPVGTRLWVQYHPSHPPAEGLTGRVWWVVTVNGESIQVSSTQGGPPVDVTTSGRVVFSELVADYRASAGEEINLAVKTSIVGELSEEQKRQFIEMNAMFLLNAKRENEGA